MAAVVMQQPPPDHGMHRLEDLVTQVQEEEAVNGATLGYNASGNVSSQAQEFSGIGMLGALVKSLEKLRMFVAWPMDESQESSPRNSGSGLSKLFSVDFQRSSSWGKTAPIGSMPPSPLSAPISPRDNPFISDSPMTETNNCLLPPLKHAQRVTLVLDLDETLVHSSFISMHGEEAHQVEIDMGGSQHTVFVAVRPGLAEFLRTVGPLFEVVVFTASMSKYADPVIDAIDPEGHVVHRLFRESCSSTFGNFVKDLERLGRDVKQCIIVDNSPAAYRLQRLNSIPITSWFSDKDDRELQALLPYLEELSGESDVVPGLRKLRRELYRTQTLNRACEGR